MTNITIQVGELLFEFPSFEHWVNTARAKFGASDYHSSAILCVDALGRICITGLEFGRARDDNAYPVRAYAMTPRPTSLSATEGLAAIQAITNTPEAKAHRRAHGLEQWDDDPDAFVRDLRGDD